MSAIRYDTLLVPYDFSAHARRALAVGADLARRLGARLHLVYAVQPPTFAAPTAAMGGAPAGAAARPAIDVAAWERDARDELEKVAASVDPGHPVESHVFSTGTLTASICAAAEQIDADLIVMGTHGRTGLAHVFLGSVTERTLRNAPCPVLAVRADEDEDDHENEEEDER